MNSMDILESEEADEYKSDPDNELDNATPFNAGWLPGPNLNIGTARSQAAGDFSDELEEWCKAQSGWGLGPETKSNGCEHIWKHYAGFNLPIDSQYHYCVYCDAKKYNDGRIVLKEK